MSIKLTEQARTIESLKQSIDQMILELGLDIVEEKGSTYVAIEHNYIFVYPSSTETEFIDDNLINTIDELRALEDQLKQLMNDYQSVDLVPLKFQKYFIRLKKSLNEREDKRLKRLQLLIDHKEKYEV